MSVYYSLIVSETVAEKRNMSRELFSSKVYQVTILCRWTQVVHEQLVSYSSQWEWKVRHWTIISGQNAGLCHEKDQYWFNVLICFFFQTKVHFIWRFMWLLNVVRPRWCVYSVGSYCTREFKNCVFMKPSVHPLSNIFSLKVPWNEYITLESLSTSDGKHIFWLAWALRK